MKAIVRKPFIFDGVTFKAGTYGDDNELTAKLFSDHWFLNAFKEKGDLILESDAQEDSLQDITEGVEQKGKRGRKKKEISDSVELEEEQPQELA